MSFLLCPPSIVYVITSSIYFFIFPCPQPLVRKCIFFSKILLLIFMRAMHLKDTMFKHI